MKKKIRSQETSSLRCKCGHDNTEHKTGECFYVLKKNLEHRTYCTCKKFEAFKMYDVQNPLEKKKFESKGCGKLIKVDLAWNEDAHWQCGQYYDALGKEMLCSKCMPKNHIEPEEVASKKAIVLSSGSDNSPKKKTLALGWEKHEDNLSSKIVNRFLTKTFIDKPNEIIKESWIEVPDIKNFIKKRISDLQNVRFGKITSTGALNKLKKDAGKELSE